MSDVTNASLVQQLRGRARDIGEPMEFAVIHPATCALIADRLEAAGAEIDRLRAERDAAVASSLVWGEGGWRVGNPHCFEHCQAQRLYAIRESLRGDAETKPAT